MAMLKLSKYVETVFINDEHKQEGKVLLLSTRTSRLVAMDIGSWKAIDRGNIDFLATDVKADLINAKILVDANADELQQVLNENKHAIKNSKVLYMAIQPSANCSLGCDYCGQQHSNVHLKSEYQKQLVEHIKQKFNPRHKLLSIGWFGAEPLMGINTIRKLTPQLQKLAKDNNVHYSATIVTNGLSLNERLAHELINEHGVRKVEITIDGPKQYHDQRRHLKSGARSFDQIYKNLLYLARNYADMVEVSIRCNVDDRNKAAMPELVEMLSRDGLLDTCAFYFAPIHSWGNDADQLIKNKQIWSQEEIEWFMLIHDRNHMVDLIPQRKKVVCLAVGEEDELIDPFGSVYKCTEVSLVPTYEKNGVNIHAIGHVSDELAKLKTEKNKFGQFNEREVINEFPCSTCNVFPVCGGMCPKEWMEGRSACPPIKYNLKERMLLSYLWNNATSNVNANKDLAHV